MIAFFDESGAHGGDDDVFTVGGWVARDRSWNRISDIWDSTLRHRVFHMNHWENRRGEFSSWPSEKRRASFIAALADSIQGQEVFGVAHSVHLDPFRRIMCPENNKLGHVKRFAYGVLLWACLNDVSFKFKPPGQVVVICERCHGVEGFAARMFDAFKKRHSLESRLGTLSFERKESFRGLQAADMLAYEGFKHAVNQAVRGGSAPERKLFSALNQKRRLAIAFAGEDNLRAWRAKYSDLPTWPPT